jgi:transcriptional regulator of acetoin/glycerol metabolism
VEPLAAVAPAAPRSYTEPLWRGRSYKDARLAVMEDFERAYLESLLDEHQGNVSQAARAAGLHRNLLHRMMSRYGLDRRKG